MEKEAPVCPCTPLCGVFFLRWRELPYEGRKSVEKRDLEYHEM